ncbi:MAG: mechanosensitive ion channel family protein [Deltaproteobacteria bacterium]|nr:mechanosensitive ion channel family protein [Deltaproteobacteria bacterium]
MRPATRLVLTLALLGASLGAPYAALAQGATSPPVNPGLGPRPAELDASTPRAALGSFQRLTQAGDFARAAHLLDLRGVPAPQQATEGPRLARRLALLLHRVRGWNAGQLGVQAGGRADPGSRADDALVVQRRVNEHRVEIRLARVPLPGQAALWLFSAPTLAEVDGLYEAVGYGWAGDRLPPTFFTLELWSVQLWQWIGLLLAFFAALLLGWLIGTIAEKLLVRIVRLTRWTWDDLVPGAIRDPLRLASFALGFVIATGLLSLADTPQAVVLRLGKVLAIVAVGWLMVRALDVATEVLHRFFLERSDATGGAMVPVARRVVKPLLVVLVAAMALQNAGLNVAGLLAGLGIGGLALAMASKTTVENMLAGILIAVDRPFKVNDFIKAGEVSGTVEEIGLRSTRVRTLERTLVTVPNAQMSDARVENFTARDRIRLYLTLNLEYETTGDQLRLIIDELKRTLTAHPDVFQDMIRVRLLGYASSSVDVEVFCYVLTTEVYRFTAIKEELLFSFGQTVRQAGAAMAFPAQRVYETKVAPSEAGHGAEASRVVAERRQANTLCLPEVPEAVRDELRRPLRERDETETGGQGI